MAFFWKPPGHGCKPPCWSKLSAKSLRQLFKKDRSLSASIQPMLPPMANVTWRCHRCYHQARDLRDSSRRYFKVTAVCCFRFSMFHQVPSGSIHSDHHICPAPPLFVQKLPPGPPGQPTSLGCLVGKSKCVAAGAMGVKPWGEQWIKTRTVTIWLWLTVCHGKIHHFW